MSVQCKRTELVPPGIFSATKLSLRVWPYHRPDEKPPGGTRTRFGGSAALGSGAAAGAAAATGAGAGAGAASEGLFCPFWLGTSVPLAGLGSSWPIVDPIVEAGGPRRVICCGSGSPPKMSVCPPPGGRRTRLDSRVLSFRPTLNDVDVILAQFSKASRLAAILPVSLAEWTRY